MDTIDRSDGYGRALLVAVGLTIAGIIAQQLTVLPALLADPALLTGDIADASIAGRTLLMVLNFVGFFLVGFAYLWWTERGLGFIDIAVPGKRGWLVILVAFVASYGAAILTNVISGLLDISLPSSQVLDFIGADPTMVLIMIAIVFLFNAPAEEFLFRGIIQKRLYEAFTERNAVIVTSAIFALVHFPVYFVGGATSVAGVSMVMVTLFIGSIIFGYSFVLTKNLVVPTLAHAFYNAFQFLLLYVVLVYGDEDDIEAVMSGLLEALPAIGL